MPLPIEKELAELINMLPMAQQQQVLDFARELVEARPRGVAGKSLTTFGGSIPVDELHRMQQAIEEGCEAVNLDEW